MWRKRWKAHLFWSCVSALPLAWGASRLLSASLVRTVAVALAALGVGVLVSRLFAAQHERERLVAFESLLGLLASRVGAGQTLERALLDAAQTLEREHGHNHPLVIAMASLRQQLIGHMNLDAALSHLSQHFRLPSVSATLAMLPPLNRAGGRLAVFLRQRHEALAKARALEADVAAEQSQTTAEMTVLLVVPFIVGGFMRLAERQTETASLATPLALAVFALSVAALMVALWIVTPSFDRQPVRRRTAPAKSDRPPKRQPRWLWALYTRTALAPLSAGLIRAAEAVYGGSDAFLRHLVAKRKALVFGAALAALGAITHALPPVAWPLLAIAPAVAHDLDLMNTNATRKASYRRTMPVLYALLVTLLESGLTLDHALTLLPLDAFPAHGPSCGTDCAAMMRALALGQSADQAVAALADRCPDAELASALHLAARYGREGGDTLLHVMQRASDQLWSIYRRAVHKAMGRRALRMVLPMGLDLLAIILAALTPALLSFSLIQ